MNYDPKIVSEFLRTGCSFWGGCHSIQRSMDQAEKLGLTRTRTHQILKSSDRTRANQILKIIRVVRGSLTQA